MERIIVRRGRFHVYELLRRTFGRDKNIEIIWDRRGQATRASGRAGRPANAQAVRTSGEQHPERRGRPLAEWNQLDYIFASGRRPDLLTRNSRRS